MPLRILSAVVLAPVALAALWQGGWAWQALMAASAAVLALEWTRLCRMAPVWRGVAFVLLGLAWAGASPLLLADTRPVVELGAAALAVWVLSRRIDLAAGTLYIGAALLALLWLRADAAAGWDNVLFVMVIVWASDIAAYLAGRLIGGARLAPAISPGKTWAGAAGGLLAGVIGGALVAGQASATVIGLAALLSVASQAGDLLESALKRHFGVKDAGHLIPGHGGLLDRVDGLLAAAPVAALLSVLIGGGRLWQ